MMDVTVHWDPDERTIRLIFDNQSLGAYTIIDDASNTYL
jgi:hypothetical protein